MADTSSHFAACSHLFRINKAFLGSFQFIKRSLYVLIQLRVAYRNGRLICKNLKKLFLYLRVPYDRLGTVSINNTD